MYFSSLLMDLLDVLLLWHESVIDVKGIGTVLGGGTLLTEVHEELSGTQCSVYIL